MPEKPSYPKMQPVGSILVCLDLTAIDTSLISYAAFMAETLAAERVIFLHAIQAYDLPDRANRKFPDVETELNEMIKDEMHRSVDEHFEEKCMWEVETQVGYEDAAKEITEFIKSRGIGLTFIGQKYGENREARYSRRIAAEAESDILFVPQYAEMSVDPILCAIDFSDESAKAFERALDISKAGGAELNCYFVSDPSRAYFPATTERSLSYYQQQAQKIQEKFLKGYGLSADEIPCRIEAGDNVTSSEAENIYRTAANRNARLIVVGAQGDTARETSLLGNLTETFRLMEKEMPIMIVKNPQRRRFPFPWLWKSE